MDIQLAVIGMGNMGGAILRGAIRAGVLTPGQILVAEQDPERLAEAEELDFRTTTTITDVIDAPNIMMAVKPQIFPEIARTLPDLPESTVVISIMAGLTSGKIRRALGGKARIVRTMPNIPCQVGEGMTAVALGDGARAGDEQLAHELFNSIGRVADVDESLMYAVTAVSGSGPAYVFLLAESMQQAAEQLGIPHGTARLLVEQTVIGAGALLRDSDRTAMDLRQAVTSPGGTTAAALEEMFERDLPETVVEALMAARNRGIELDQESD